MDPIELGTPIILSWHLTAIDQTEPTFDLATWLWLPMVVPAPNRERWNALVEQLAIRARTHDYELEHDAPLIRAKNVDSQLPPLECFDGGPCALELTLTFKDHIPRVWEDAFQETAWHKARLHILSNLDLLQPLGFLHLPQGPRQEGLYEISGSEYWGNMAPQAFQEWRALFEQQHLNQLLHPTHSSTRPPL